jgi:hypothetical protein
MVGGIIKTLYQTFKEVLQWGVAWWSSSHKLNEGTQLFSEDARRLYEDLQKIKPEQLSLPVLFIPMFLLIL